jgi:CRP/FNR family transcriptional regulator, cyclic AMP receptor protein
MKLLERVSGRDRAPAAVARPISRATSSELPVNNAERLAEVSYHPAGPWPPRAGVRGVPVDAERLANIPIFASLTDDERAAVAAKLEERDARPGEHLSTEGGAGYFFFVIETGSATVTRDGETLANFGPGDFFGEAAIFKTRRRTATVTATAPTVLLAMFGADFAKVTGDIPALHATIDAALAARLPD